ncbi:unnamed protein product [Mycena citricolor]|uniref:Poly A polymerase head domain-containing protein n=1 Tax=Mycena citricolor TaxID=2018698 RepID=A0AAD2JVQ9_9AGAR|nr:unnamed protein product [Mycena citricolor]
MASLPTFKFSGNTNIQLTPVEAELCTFIDECCADLQETKGINNTCRIAGGWLLGKESNDIDIALSNIMGDEFAEHLARFAEKRSVQTGPIAIFNPNPEQSKHLRTARIPIFELELDLVNLRSEEYAADSRIPTAVAFGTPLQDALRRDITINALFYNVHTRTVEDCTGKGIEDLKNGIVRTPLPPRETFIDDPLRILRSIRFASRYGFTIVSDLEESVKDPVIQNALVTKVARERVGEELTKMLKGPDPKRSIDLINHLTLYDPVFNVLPSETTLSSPLAPRSTSLDATFVLDSLLDPSGTTFEPLPRIHPSLIQAVSKDPTARPRLFLAAALTPYLGLTYQDRKKKALPAVELAIRESLKLGAQYHFADGIPLLFSAAQYLKNPDLSEKRFQDPSERVALGLLLREKMMHHPASGARWQLAVLFSLVQELALVCPSGAFDAVEATRLLELYNAFVSRIEELELSDVGEEKPLLNGHITSQILGASKPGQWTGAVLARVMEWQLEHPKSTAEHCTAWLKEEHGAGRITINDSSEPASKRLKTKR